jgi:membrane fusion protein, multidrug efflux system
MRTNTKLWLATVSGIVVGIGGLVGTKAGQIGKMIGAGKSFRPPPEAVSTATVETSEWQPTIAAVGSLVAVHGVTLGAELTGLVREVLFDSGAAVRKGAILVQLDAATEIAQLGAAQADADLAKANLERARMLRQSGAVTVAELDQAQARARQTAAQVAALEATIAKKTVRAPFAGRVAIRQVEVGQVVSPGTPILSLQSSDPIYADFWLAQQALAQVRAGQRLEMRTDTFPDRTWEGRVTTINTEVDPSTRNIRIRATLANPDETLRPGMYVNLEVLAGDKHPVLSIPSTAALYAPYGDSVFVIEAGKDESGQATMTARQRFIRLGERRGDWVAVANGLEAGDTIVSSGAFKLHNGSSVVVKNDLAPTAELSPKPTDK